MTGEHTVSLPTWLATWAADGKVRSDVFGRGMWSPKLDRCDVLEELIKKDYLLRPGRDVMGEESCCVS